MDDQSLIIVSIVGSSTLQNTGQDIPLQGPVDRGARTSYKIDISLTISTCLFVINLSINVNNFLIYRGINAKDSRQN